MGKSTAIKVVGLGKKYLLGGAEKAGASFREMLTGALAAPFRRLRRLQGERAEEEVFWALRNVDFDVNPGEVVGIIGRNGAGKSTLLKILSRITDPAEGRIEIRGRVSSLLEVGTGFHPELTGRENIFLNGAILGMPRSEIHRKFDEIVAFSEVERFLDTPVKRYSSGMYVRLAFSVAAHLEPEILIVDEVLAVGDAAFQKKCLGKMQDVGKEGRTVLFVSHNMAAIQQLTSRCVLLENGAVKFDGATHEALCAYQDSQKAKLGEPVRIVTDSFSISMIQMPKSNVVEYGQPVCVEIAIQTHQKVNDLAIGLGINNSLGGRILTSVKAITSLEMGEYRMRLEVFRHHLPPGRYSIDVGIQIAKRNFVFEDKIIIFDISPVGVSDYYMLTRGDALGVFIEPEITINETGI